MLVGAPLARQIRALVDLHIADKFKYTIGKIRGMSRFIRHAELFQGIGKTHDAKTYGTILPVRTRRLFDRKHVYINEIIKLAHGSTNRLLKHVPVKLLAFDVACEIERGQVTDRDIIFVLRQADLRTEVRHVDRAGGVVEGAQVDGI